MSEETKTCQQCNETFTIEPEDFQFYEKMDVPAPTFCWICRMKRRMNWRNERSLYKRTCDATGKTVISIYHPDEPVTVYDFKYWWSDEWDAMDYGRDYDFDRSFFEQWKELHDAVPHMSVSNANAVNSDYCNFNHHSKNAYLIMAAYSNEDVMYSNRVAFNTDCMDVYIANQNERCYECLFTYESYNLRYSQDCKSCSGSYFLYDCVGCSDCFMSSNLRNKSYVFRNEQLSKDEYQKRIQEIDFGSYSEVRQLREEFEEVKKNGVHKYANLSFDQNSTGDNLHHVKNCNYCFDVSDRMEDCKYSTWGVQSKDIFDGGPGIGILEQGYEFIDSGMQGNKNCFTGIVYSSNDIQYCFNCYSCQDCFGCIGLQSKQYCILNKQYSKEEYLELLPKIKQQMMEVPYTDSKGREYRYGEFFPAELSPFAYNETVAQEYFPIEQEEAENTGLRWREKEASVYSAEIAAEELPDSIDDVGDDIANKTVECIDRDKDHSPGAFRITPQELKFYKDFRIPLPRKSPDARHYDRLAKRNPIYLWKRTTEDGVEVLTPYSPDRPEKIYSDEGYKNMIL